MFRGMVPFGSGTYNCSSCHYITRTDTLNWNPAAYDMALLWQEDPGYSIKEKLDNPTGRRMIADHAEMTITPEEEQQLEAYFQYILTQGPGELKAVPLNGMIFWGMGILMALALVDLFFTKKIRYRFIPVMIIILGLMIHMRYAMAEAQNLGRTQGYAPDQPIKFSHVVHVADNETECTYCHHSSHNSISAGIPSNNTCLNCHNVVREGSHSGRFEINKIHRAAQTGQQVNWIRVHNLPDHSRFPHAQHVDAAGIACTECHGEVEQMHIIHQAEPLAMGWCLSCHRETEVRFTDNPYYHQYEQLQKAVKEGRMDRVTAARLTGEDCYVCHH